MLSEPVKLYLVQLGFELRLLRCIYTIALRPGSTVCRSRIRHKLRRIELNMLQTLDCVAVTRVMKTILKATVNVLP